MVAPDGFDRNTTWLQVSMDAADAGLPRRFAPQAGWWGPAAQLLTRRSSSSSSSLSLAEKGRNTGQLHFTGLRRFFTLTT